MIPKVIHYCWFGDNELPRLAKKCIKSWKEKCPDYEIKMWNEQNVDINSCEFVKEAYQAKKWAFVSDYVRLWIIYNEGGIYLDVDVELLSSMNPILNDNCFLGTEKTGLVNTGLGFGAEKGNPVIREMMNEYENHHFILPNGQYDVVPCPQKNTLPLYKRGFVFSNNIWSSKYVTIYPPEWFCPLDYETGEKVITKNTISIHHFTATWHSGSEMRKSKITRFCIKHFGKKIGTTVADIVCIPDRIALKIKKVTIKFYNTRIKK